MTSHINEIIKAKGIRFVRVLLIAPSCDGCAFIYNKSFKEFCDIKKCKGGIIVPEPTPHNLIAYRLIK